MNLAAVAQPDLPPGCPLFAVYKPVPTMRPVWCWEARKRGSNPVAAVTTARTEVITDGTRALLNACRRSKSMASSNHPNQGQKISHNQSITHQPVGNSRTQPQHSHCVLRQQLTVSCAVLRTLEYSYPPKWNFKTVTSVELARSATRAEAKGNMDEVASVAALDNWQPATEGSRRLSPRIQRAAQAATSTSRVAADHGGTRSTVQPRSPIRVNKRGSPGRTGYYYNKYVGKPEESSRDGYYGSPRQRGEVDTPEVAHGPPAVNDQKVDGYRSPKQTQQVSQQSLAPFGVWSVCACKLAWGDVYCNSG